MAAARTTQPACASGSLLERRAPPCSLATVTVMEPRTPPPCPLRPQSLHRPSPRWRPCAVPPHMLATRSALTRKLHSSEHDRAHAADLRRRRLSAANLTMGPSSPLHLGARARSHRRMKRRLSSNCCCSGSFLHKNIACLRLSTMHCTCPNSIRTLLLSRGYLVVIIACRFTVSVLLRSCAVLAAHHQWRMHDES
jgi:hypothetical protein